MPHSMNVWFGSSRRFTGLGYRKIRGGRKRFFNLTGATVRSQADSCDCLVGFVAIASSSGGVQATPAAKRHIIGSHPHPEVRQRQHITHGLQSRS